MGVESTVETAGLVGVAVDTILNLLRSVAYVEQLIFGDGEVRVGEDVRLKWLACPCMGPRPPICHMS